MKTLNSLLLSSSRALPTHQIKKWVFFFYLSLEIISFRLASTVLSFYFKYKMSSSCLLTEISITSIIMARWTKSCAGYLSRQYGTILPVSLKKNLCLTPKNKSLISLAWGQDGGRPSLGRREAIGLTRFYGPTVNINMQKDLANIQPSCNLVPRAFTLAGGGTRKGWLLLEWMLQNMVRHFLTH